MGLGLSAVTDRNLLIDKHWPTPLVAGQPGQSYNSPFGVRRSRGFRGGRR